ncbi:MAG TPA: hypothetical protein VGJ18_22725 [Gemmatimonadaceae bacterium]|jgi:hypothetical protein
MQRSSPHRRKAHVLAGILAIGVAACSETRTPTQPRVPVSAARTITALTPGVRPAEEHFHSLAREIPGFGGYFIDSTGGLVAYVTDLTRGDALRTRLGAIRRAHRLGARNPSISIRKGDFDFPSLAHWRDLVSTHILGVVPGVVMSDADEAANRVTIGIDEKQSPRVRGEVLRLLGSIGVPVNAVRFIQSTAASVNVAAPKARSASIMLENQNLSDEPSPVVAGYKISVPGGFCTLGPIVTQNGHPAAMTASHCTAATYALDGSTISTVLGTLIGQEQVDPSPNCGSHCRNSDASLFYLTAGLANDFGRIARTTDISFTWGTSGSPNVDQTNPTRNVIQAASYWDVTSGMTLYKTGWRTGTTGGYITATCSDQIGADGFVRACSIISTYYADEGDSGAPVFAFIPGRGPAEVELVGIHWGANPSNQTAASSYFYWATSEIGGTIESTLPASLYEYISGESDVNNSPSCRLTYTANVSGGAAPYTYSWNTDGTILQDNGSSVVANFAGPAEGHFISVNVTDANGASYGSEWEITAEPDYDMCYN